MASRLPIMGLALVNRNFNTFIRQMGQVERSQQLASGAMVDTAKAAQKQVVALNNLSKSAVDDTRATQLQAEAKKLSVGLERAALKAKEEIFLREQLIGATRNKAIQENLRNTIGSIKEELAARTQVVKQRQLDIRDELTDIASRKAARSAESKEFRQNLRENANQQRINTEVTRQHAAAIAILGAAMVTVGASALLFTKNLVQQGAQTEKLTTAADIATRSRGYRIETVEKERKELEALYVTQQRANRTLQQFAMVGLDVTKASDFMTAAQDLSVGSTQNLTQVYESLTQAITTGNVTRLRELALSNDITRIKNWYADTLGKVGDELTVVEEKEAILAYIMARAQGMQGAWAAQLNKTSGQLEIFNFRLTSIRDTLATHLLPIFNQVLGGVLALLEAFQRLPQPVQKFIAVGTALAGVLLTAGGAFLLLKPAISAVVTAVGVVLPYLSKLLLIGTSVSDTILNWRIAFLLIPAPIKIAAAAIALLTTAIITNFGGLRDLFDRTIGSFLSSFKTAFVDSIPWIRASISVVVDAITWPIRAAFQWLDTQIRSITGKLAEDGWGFEFNAEDFFVGAAASMGGYAAGLLYGFNQFVLPMVIDIVNFIASFLGGSLPTEGPLAHIKTSGIEIIQAWSQGMKSVSLDDLRDLAEEVEETLRQAMYRIQDALFDVQTEELQLDKLLQPFEDALFLIRASTDLITIPLEQQTREMERQVEVLEKQAKVERERAEQYLRTLEKQAEAIQKIIDADEERVEVIDHEIFIEEQRLKIMGKATSIRLLELRGQKRLTEDTIKGNEQSLSVTEDQISVEEERLEALVTAAEAQIKALQTQIDTINASIELEEERVKLAQEALRMEEARQAQARLALLEETRFWEAEQRLASHYLDIIGRVSAAETERAAKGKKAIDDIKKDLDGLFDLVPVFEPEIDDDKFGLDLDAMKQKLKDAFLGAIPDEMWEETTRLLGELEVSWGKLGEAWAKQLEDSFETFFTTTLPTNIAKWLFGPEYDEAFDESGVRLEQKAYTWGELIKKALWEGFWGAWALDINTTVGKMFDDLDDAMQIEVVKLWDSIAPGFLQGLRDAMPSKEEIAPIVADFNKIINDLFFGKEETGFFTGGPEGEFTTRLETSIFDPVQQWIDNNIPDFTAWQEEFTTGWTTFVEGLIYGVLGEKIGTQLLQWIADEKEKIQEGESPGGLVEWGQAFLDFPKDYVTDLLVDSLELITGILLPWISPDAELRIIESLITWGNAFLDWVAKDATPFIAEKLDVFMAEITRWMTDTGNPTMYEHGEDLSDSLVKGLEDATEDNQSRLEDVGVEMLEGIKKGLDDEFDDFRKWLRKKLQEIIDAVEDELGIKSPSTVFANIGTQMVLGMEKGFEGETDTWMSRGLKQSLRGTVEAGEQLVQNFQRGAQEAWPSFETWLLNSIRSLSQDVSFGMGSMMNTIVMTPQASSTPTVNNYSTTTNMSISPNYARVQSVASIRDDVGMMLALRR